MENHELEKKLNDESLNRGDKCTIQVTGGKLLKAEFIEFIDYNINTIPGFTGYNPNSYFIRVKIEENKTPYLTTKDGVELWQVQIKEVVISSDKIENIKNLL